MSACGACQGKTYISYVNRGEMLAAALTLAKVEYLDGQLCYSIYRVSQRNATGVISC